MFIETGLNVGGLNFFELLTIAFSLLLAGLALWHSITGNFDRLSLTEWISVAFVAWCTVAVLVYPENSNFKTFVKFVFPLVTFMVLKRIILTREQYLSLIRWMIKGFAVPVALSGIWTVLGRGIGQEIYWTGLVRYQGVYADIHHMGHCMGFLIMLCVIYTTLNRSLTGSRVSLVSYIGLTAISVVALFCLYKSQTRTVYFGLLVFFVLVFLFYNRSQLLIFVSVLVCGAILFAPLLSTIFYDFVDAAQGKKVEMAGSGRPYIWKHNLEIFSSLPLDKQLAGVGIGNTLMGDGEQFTQRTKISIDNVWNSHNDFLELLMETGAIGLILWAALMCSIVVKILQFNGSEKWAFFAAFAAIFLMNCMSNSYISRFGLAQMFFMLFCYFEIPAREKPNEQTSVDRVLA